MILSYHDSDISISSHDIELEKKIRSRPGADYHDLQVSHLNRACLLHGKLAILCPLTNTVELYLVNMNIVVNIIALSGVRFISISL